MKQMQKLDGLLQQANQFSTYLREEMLRAEVSALAAAKKAVAEAAGAAGKAAGKRGSGKLGGPASKRAKKGSGAPEPLAPTQVGDNNNMVVT